MKNYLFRLDDKRVIDATEKGGVGKFINHSCHANCQALKVEVDGLMKIAIFSLRKIKAGEEVCVH